MVQNIFNENRWSVNTSHQFSVLLIKTNLYLINFDDNTLLAEELEPGSFLDNDSWTLLSKFFVNLKTAQNCHDFSERV